MVLIIRNILHTEISRTRMYEKCLFLSSTYPLQKLARDDISDLHYLLFLRPGCDSIEHGSGSENYVNKFISQHLIV